MNYYFVDYENVHSEGFVGIEKVQEKDVIYVVYSEQSKTFSLDILEKIERQKAFVRAHKVKVGSKNALDFQLSSFLGYIIGKTETEDCNYYIVSRDMGYDRVVEFWTEKEIRIGRIINLSGENPAVGTKEQAVTTKTKTSSKNNTKDITKATKEELLKVLSEEEYSERILEIINSYKSKQAISNGLSKEFKDSKKSGAIYKKIKPLLKEKKKS